MKKILILSMLILCVASLIYGAGPTEYTAQNVLCLVFRDSDGNALASQTSLTSQNVLSYCFDSSNNALNVTFSGSVDISTASGVSAIWWLDGSTWTATSIMMGTETMEYTNYTFVFSSTVVTEKLQTAAGNDVDNVALSTAAVVVNTAEIAKLVIDTTTNRTDIDTNTAEINQLRIDTTTNRTDIDSNTEQIEGLVETALLRYLYSTESTEHTPGYYVTSSTPQASAVTRVKTLSGTNIIVSSWVVDVTDITTIPSGEWHVEFYAYLDKVNTTNIWFEIYDGTGAAIADAGSFIMGTAKSKPLTQAVAEYFVYITTNQYTMQTDYLTLVMMADESGADPALSYVMGGVYDSHLHFPALREEVSVTEITEGTNIGISPASGKGNVTVSLDSSISLKETNLTDGTTVAGKQTNNGDVEIATGKNVSFGSSARYITDDSGNFCLVISTELAVKANSVYINHASSSILVELKSSENYKNAIIRLWPNSANGDARIEFGTSSDFFNGGWIYQGDEKKLNKYIDDILVSTETAREKSYAKGYEMYISSINTDRVIYPDGSEQTTASSGSGKAVMSLYPGSAKLPNSQYARLEKITRGDSTPDCVDNVLKFDALATGTTEYAYWQVPCPSFYAGGNLTITSYAVLDTTETAGAVATMNVGVKAKAHGEDWDDTFTDLGNISINPTGTSGQLLVDTLAWSSNKPTAGDMLCFRFHVTTVDSTFAIKDANFDADVKILSFKIEED